MRVVADIIHMLPCMAQVRPGNALCNATGLVCSLKALGDSFSGSRLAQNCGQMLLPPH